MIVFFPNRWILFITEDKLLSIKEISNNYWNFIDLTQMFQISFTRNPIEISYNLLDQLEVTLLKFHLTLWVYSVITHTHTHTHTHTYICIYIITYTYTHTHTHTHTHTIKNHIFSMCECYVYFHFNIWFLYHWTIMIEWLITWNLM